MNDNFRNVIKEAMKSGMSAEDIANDVTKILNEEKEKKAKEETVESFVKDLFDKIQISPRLVTSKDAAAYNTIAASYENKSATLDELKRYYDYMLEQVPSMYKVYHIATNVVDELMSIEDNKDDELKIRSFLNGIFD